jgi:lycopene cyclase domain-containing protein
LSLVYLTALLVSILGLGLLDFRHKLALFVSPFRTVVTVGLPVLAFLAWDLLGIANGVFFRGENNLMTGILLADELPIEELFFLILLCYNSLLAYLAIARRFQK